MKRISFDVDGVLTTARGRVFARQKIAAGYDVWIVTARQYSEFNSAFSLAKELGIQESKVIFTNGKDKWKFIQKYKISVHYDNNPEQIDKIDENTRATGVLVNYKK